MAEPFRTALRRSREEHPTEKRMDIRIDDLTGPDIRSLLNEHLTSMHELSPPESVHALDLDALRRPEITFWTLWDGKELLGCGALKRLDAGHAEIKSMRTAAKHLRTGVARRLLEHILDEAAKCGYKRVSLETGSFAAFEPARRLYAGFGFEFCPPFAEYIDDPNSVFMTKRI
jgi:putative acetyltransferase